MLIVDNFMTKEEFKQRWESDMYGGRITNDDVAQCAEHWGLVSHSKIKPMDQILYKVLKHTNVNDAEDFKP